MLRRQDAQIPLIGCGEAQQVWTWAEAWRPKPEGYVKEKDKVWFGRGSKTQKKGSVVGVVSVLLVGVLRATMCASLSFLQSAFASSQQLPLLPKFAAAKPLLPSFPIIEAKAKTRREDRTARHVRIRKKVFFSWFFLALGSNPSSPYFNYILCRIRVR